MGDLVAAYLVQQRTTEANRCLEGGDRSQVPDAAQGRDGTGDRYYKVPREKLSDLARYDGSVYVDLAHDVITGKRSVEDARKFYPQAMMAQFAAKSASGPAVTPALAPTGTTGGPGAA
jgi:hypothetical protein